MRQRILIFTLVLSSLLSLAQSTGFYSGKIIDSKDTPINKVIVLVNNQKTETDSLGNFKLVVPANKLLSSTFIHPKFHLIGENFKVDSGETKKTTVKLLEKDDNIEIDVIDIDSKRNRSKANEIEIDKRDNTGIIGINGDGIEFIKMQGGVNSNNELSSAYNVRGGSFDENLIYVNGIQVYRPFLVRAGQQEGLSFVNSDMVSDITFSAGGFDAKYGDKLSSVLDINYLSPDTTMAAINASMLGANITFGNRYKKFSYIMSGRYKSNSYLLGSLETQADYRPLFFDYQTYLKYEANKKWSFSFLGNSSLNQFRMVPQTRTTRFGGINQAFQLTVYFNGQEISKFQTNFGAFSADFKPYGNDSTVLKLTVSALSTTEEETYDIEGAYRLNELETNFGEDDFGKEAA